MNKIFIESEGPQVDGPMIFSYGFEGEEIEFYQNKNLEIIVAVNMFENIGPFENQTTAWRGVAIYFLQKYKRQNDGFNCIQQILNKH